MSEFTWTPSRGFTTEITPRVRIAKFGDGYSQRVSDGINTIDQTWNLQFQNNTVETIAEIEAFLVSKQGGISFTWTPTSESEVWVICNKWSRTYENEISRSLSATFERVYD
jgi:phage-related protein